MSILTEVDGLFPISIGVNFKPFLRYSTPICRTPRNVYGWSLGSRVAGVDTPPCDHTFSNQYFQFISFHNWAPGELRINSLDSRGLRIACAQWFSSWLLVCGDLTWGDHSSTHLQSPNSLFYTPVHTSPSYILVYFHVFSLQARIVAHCYTFRKFGREIDSSDVQFFIFIFCCNNAGTHKILLTIKIQPIKFRSARDNPIWKLDTRKNSVSLDFFLFTKASIVFIVALYRHTHGTNIPIIAGLGMHRGLCYWKWKIEFSKNGFWNIAMVSAPEFTIGYVNVRTHG